MSDFKAKMHQILFPLGLSARPHWGSLQHSPRSLAVYKGPISNWREEKGRLEEGRWEGKVKVGVGEGFGNTKKFRRLPPMNNGQFDIDTLATYTRFKVTAFRLTD